MLLAADIGNSSIKFGIFDGGDLLSKFSVQADPAMGPADLTDEIAGRIDREVTAAVVSSVVPELDPSLRTYLQLEHNVDPLFVTNTFDFGLRINYEPIAAAGTDRLVAASAAADKYGTPVIVCDFGTATTIDCVTGDREYLGGVITPGMNTMAASLHLKTSKLPLVAITRPAKVIGSSTIASIQSGIFWGYVGLVEKMVPLAKAEMKEDAKVVATGGFAELMAAETAVIDVVDLDLVLDGLALLYKKKGAASPS